MSFFDTYGFAPFFQEQLSATETMLPARVVNVQRHHYRLASACGLITGQISGRFEFTAIHRSDYPQVGDWVLFRGDETQGVVIIERVLKRKSVLERKGVASHTSQVIAANIDTVILVQSCNQDLNLRRLERYLAACGDDRLAVTLVFNKSDLLTLPDKLPFALPDSWNYPVHLLSANTGANLQDLATYLQPGKTCVLLGSSGVGKSTIINGLSSSALQSTQDIRDTDGKGRHTTTTRELFFADSGGMIIDTPGMREFGLADADVEASGAFSDLLALANQCQFRDCQHDREPMCAVRIGVEAGNIEAKRLESWRKLQKEEAYYARRNDPRADANSKKRWKAIHKQTRSHPKKQR